MYSPDFADRDPRNPMNAADDANSVFYISPDQLTECETPDSAIDRWIEEESEARGEAKRLAKVTGHRIVVQEHLERDDGTHEFVSSFTVFPWGE